MSSYLREKANEKGDESAAEGVLFVTSSQLLGKRELLQSVVHLFYAEPSTHTISFYNVSEEA